MNAIKATLLLLLSITLNTVLADTPPPITFKHWIPYGNADFAPCATAGVALAIHSAGESYVGYELPNKISVMMLKNNVWVPAGQTDFSNPSDTNSFSLVMNSSNPKSKPYLSYLIGHNCSESTCQLVVKHFDGKNWKTVGSNTLPAFSSAAALTMGNHGTLYLLNELAGSPALYRIFKFNGHNWEKMGNDINSNISISPIYIKSAPNGDLFFACGHILRELINNTWKRVTYLPGNAKAWAIGPNGTVYDAGHKNMLPFVMALRKNSTTWKIVGQFSTAIPNEFYGASEFSLAISSKGTPYLSFVGFDVTLKRFAIFAMRLDQHSNQWISIANTNITPQSPQYSSLTLDSKDIPYLSFAANKTAVYTLSN